MEISLKNNIWGDALESRNFYKFHCTHSVSVGSSKHVPCFDKLVAVEFTKEATTYFVQGIGLLPFQHLQSVKAIWENWRFPACWFVPSGIRQLYLACEGKGRRDSQDFAFITKEVFFNVQQISVHLKSRFRCMQWNTCWNACFVHLKWDDRKLVVFLRLWEWICTGNVIWQVTVFLSSN